MAQCVFCSKPDNLNTSMTITLEDGQKVSVDICDEHAEEATIKSARAAYQGKQAQIEEVLAQAKALGLNIGQTTGGLTVVESATPDPVPDSMTVQAIEKPAAAPAAPLLEQDDPDVVPTSKIDGRAGMQSVGGNVSGTAVPSHNSHSMNDLGDKLPAGTTEGHAKMVMAEGRGGQPIMIPKKRVDGTGTTRINISQNETDAQLQERFKRMGQTSQSSHDNQAGPDFRAGYQDTTRDCPFCRGEMEVNGKECPKCKGTGIISVY